MSTSANSNIIPLTTNNTISDIMSKVNEIVYQLNTFYDAQFDFLPISANTTSWLEGRVFYNEDNHALSYFNDDPNILVNVGQDVVVRVANDKPIDISKGDAIYIDGVVNNIPSVDLAIANTSTSTSIIVGLATGDISANSAGYITLMGFVSDIDTSDFLENDDVYLSDTNVGKFTNIKPVNKLSIKLGLVTKSDPSNGSILVKPDSGSSTLESYFTATEPKLDDVIIHDGYNFKNISKLNLTDGGNF